jgi:hypothetical protein
MHTMSIWFWHKNRVWQQWWSLLKLRRRREKGWCLDPLSVVVLVVLLLSTAWCIPHLGVSCTDLNSSSIGAVTRNTSSSSSFMLLLHLHIRQHFAVELFTADVHLSTSSSRSSPPSSSSPSPHRYGERPAIQPPPISSPWTHRPSC